MPVISPAPAPEVRTPDAEDDEDDMDSTSKSKTTNEYDSTVRVARLKTAKISVKKLRFRHIWLDPSPDDELAHFKDILITELPAKSLKDTEDLQHLMRDFLQQATDHSAEICYPYVDEFSFNFDEGKSKLNYPIVNERYFQADLKRCRARNEAILQRTIMIHIIDHHWLGEKFDWNCEGQWSLPKDSRLPSTADDVIALPKPDLSISFTLKSFTQADAGSEPIPEHLDKTMSPDGDPRCFPFLFIEVKRAGADLEEAYMTNLHNASQALYNMYTWVVGTEKTMKDFFQVARVFSLVLNAQDLSVRIHRPFRLENGDLSFRFDEFWPLARYSRNKVCQLIKTILKDYAAKELHDILKSAFTEVTKQEYEIVRSKRKAELARSGSSKRTRKN